MAGGPSALILLLNLGLQDEQPVIAYILMPRKQAYSSYPVKKTANNMQKLSYEDRFESVTTTPLIQEVHERLKKRINKLTQILVRYSLVWNKQVPTDVMVLRNYAQCYHEYYEYDQFDTTFELLPSLDVNLYTVGNEEIIYKSWNIFRDCNWQVRFHSKLASKMAGFQANQILYILSFVYFVAMGNFIGKGSLLPTEGKFGYVTPIGGKNIPHNRFFLLKLFREKTILFHVGVEKVPVVKSGVIKRYEFQNYIQFLDILSDQVAENPKKVSETIERFQEQINADVAKRDHSDELVIEVIKNKKKQTSELFIESINPYTNLKEIFEYELQSSSRYVFTPFVFKPLYISYHENSTLVFDKNMKRWISNEELTRMEKKALNAYQKKVNEEMIKRFVDFQSAKTLVQLLTKIPNFKVELTEQEKDVIGENGNVLVIGRSGTGKTTCAVLRLFAIEMLFKIRLSLSKRKYESQLKDTRCSADDIDQTMGLHCIFLTASPVLTNEIQRYYKKLTDNIKTELEKKRKKVAESESAMKKKQQVPESNATEEEQFQQMTPQKQEDEEIIEKGSDDENVEAPEKLEVKKSKEAMEEEQGMNEELGGIQLEEKIENENFEEDEEDFDEMKEQLELKMKKFKSLQDLDEKDYPGFFTVKSFIMMIDGTLKKPFFIRKENEANEHESQATWHNERKGIMMIENYHKNHDEEDEAEVEDNNQELEEEVNYSDEEELEHEYLRQIQLRENKDKQKLTEKLNKNKKNVSFEVDFDYFDTYFWPTIRHKYYSGRKITSHLVWTEIFSTIKGGASSHLYPGLYMPEKVYIQESSNVFLTKEEKLDVYESFCQYERWKMSNGGYDLLDAVNYILNFIRFRGYDGPEIHYIMIDEVQDLPHSIVYLLSKTVRYGVFYSGDTAQTIAKGVGFRFCDLKNLFDSRQFDVSLKLSKPVVKQLTVNFRSHNNILQLANSIVSSLEILFPKTIDRLKKEVSNLHGPKPMILAEGNVDLLFYVLCGDDSYKKSVEQENSSMKKPPLEFGCDQVIIVRDQQSKDNIPATLQHALCLTIYEAKGLEFNDVILFNFFSDSSCREKWHLIKYLNVVVSEMDKEEYENSITKHEQTKKPQEENKMTEGEAEEEDVNVECLAEHSESGKVQVKRLVSNAKTIQKDINDYAELCSELKMLYTAVTRPRKTLIIYDDDATARKSVERMWEKLGVVEVVSKEIIEAKNQTETEEIKIFKSIVNSTNDVEWKKQGLKMYARGYFEQAMKCFQRSGHEELYKKAKANSIADMATKKLIEIESERNAMKNKLVQYQKMSESAIGKLKRKLKKDEVSTFAKFEEAAAIFNELLMFKQAGQCYFSGKKFQKAFESFSKAFMNKQAAESLEMLNQYREAAVYYEKDGNYLKVIECLDMVNEWEEILKVIQSYSNLMSEIEKQSLFKKYTALALQELVYEIEFENEAEEDRPENNRVEVIKEEEDSQEEEDWDEDEDPEVEAERQLRKRSEESLLSSRKMSEESELSNQRKLSSLSQEPSRKQSGVDSDKVIQESVYEQMNDMEEARNPTKKMSLEEPSMVESSFSDLNESQSLGQHSKPQIDIMQSIVDQKPSEQEGEEKKNEPLVEKDRSFVEGDSSFADLNSEESSFADLNSVEGANIRYPSELEPDIESIKSLADREDSWIRSALSDIAANTHTEYSIIDESEHYNTNVRIIKTRGNIFVQDEVMRKIVNIVSIINSTIDEFFKQFKGYQSLLTLNKDTANIESMDNRPEISEFEEVDPALINIILDTLESFKLYKLCLFVCNRYHLPHKAGRYLVSMGLKYSTNAQINTTLNSALISPSVNRKSELEKGILASIAIHAILENVSSDFLKIKVRQEEHEEKNTLGAYFIEGLIVEGLYKKAVFMVNPEESLRILQNFKDASIYQEVFKQKFLPNCPQEAKPDFLKHLPKSTLESNYTVVKLEECLIAYNVTQRFQLISTRFFKEFNTEDYQLKLTGMTVPDYTPFIKALVSKEEGQITQALLANVKDCYQILNNGPDYRIYDFVSFCTTVINTEHLFKPTFEIPHSEFLDLYHCLKTIFTSFLKITGPKSLEIIQAVLSVYGCRLIEPCKSIRFLNDGFAFVSRTSIICNDFIEQLKKNKDETAFFFEQDYNLILVRAGKLLEIISKKMELAFAKYIRHRANFKKPAENPYLYEDFLSGQAESLIKLFLHEEENMILYKRNKKVKTAEKPKKVLKKERPTFNFKNQGRPELCIDLNESSEQDNDSLDEVVKATYNYIFPDLDEKFKYMSESALRLFRQKSLNSKSAVSGRVLYCSGLNDSYKEYVTKLGGYNLYDAFEFRKFNRLDLYCDNILSVVGDLSINEKHVLSADILIHLLILYKSLTEGKNFKLDISRQFLKFLPQLKFVEAVGTPEITHDLVKTIIEQKNNVCVFAYENKFTCECEPAEIVDLMVEFWEILRLEETSNWINIAALTLVYLVNMKPNINVYETLRILISSVGSDWTNPIFQKMKKADDYEGFCELRESILADKDLLGNSVMWHQIKVTDKSDLKQAIKDSEVDYDIKEKIMLGRKKAANTIGSWWKMMLRKKTVVEDAIKIVQENRIVRCLHKEIKYLPSDDRLLVRSAAVRNVLISFYLRNVVTSSLDFHFILMTLNRIEACRSKYLKAYSNKGLVEDMEFDFEEEINSIEQTVQVWKSDSKWLKDRNMELKRKKVFQVKWMTRNLIQNKIIKKRAGLKKQVKLQKKKEMIKKR